MDIPFVDLHENYKRISDRIDRELAEVINQTSFIGGDKLAEFERNFADYIGVEHGVGVASGTDAIFLGLKAAGIGVGDEVITVSNTFVSTVDGIIHNGARPRFVDIDADTYTMDPNRVEEAVNEDTKAIMPVHLYGQPADLNPLREIANKHDLLLIEDAAQAHGARYEGKRVGSIGDLAFFSFYPSKNLGAFGDGGLVATDNDDMAEQIRMLREYGESTKYEHQEVGYNSRLDTLQAAVLDAKLPELDQWNEERRDAAALYNDLLADIPILTPDCAPFSDHIYHLYVIQTKNKSERRALKNHLEQNGVSTGIHYPIPVHEQPSYQQMDYKFADLQTTQKTSRRILSLPMYPEIEKNEIRYIVDKIETFYED